MALMSTVTDSLSPYSVFQLQFPQTTFRLERYPSSTTISSLDSASNNSLRLQPAGGSLASAIGSGAAISVQEQILSSYSDGAALVTKAVYLKGGIVA
jgi:hypothetical protein